MERNRLWDIESIVALYEIANVPGEDKMTKQKFQLFASLDFGSMSRFFENSLQVISHTM